jgi:hypothetical protein
MPRYPGFVGGTATEWSLNVNAERTINFFPVLARPGTPKSPIVLYGTPGLRIFASGSSRGGPVRALFAQDGRVFAVIGGTFYEVTEAGALVPFGAVLVDEWPATICSNGVGGSQLFITSGGAGYIFDLQSEVFTQITTEGFPLDVVMGDYCDGYFLVLTRGSHQFSISSLNNGLEWDALDTAQVSASSNNLVALVVDHREVWLFGTRSTEPWYNTGNADFPFGPIQGTFVEHGTLAPWSVQQLDNTLFWLGGDERGAGVVYRMQGYIPVRISTDAVDLALQRSTQLGRTLAWTYQEAGHAFYVLYVPDLETTWVYDIAVGLWHERAMWDTTFSRWWPHVARCHCYAWNRHLVGDRQSSAIYTYDMDYFDDELLVAEGLG